MDINIPREKIIEIGRRVMTDFLAEQGGYTLGIAAAEGEALTDLLPEGFIDYAQGLRDQVNLSRKDKTLMAEESKDATSVQNDAASRAKVWRRRAVRRATRATRFGHSKPDGLLKIGNVSTLAGLTGQLKEMTALYEKHLAKMPGKDPTVLLDEGKAILSLLSTADADQDVKRLRDLPGALRRFYELKGLLYFAIKAINDAGHELYADDATSASRFNLHILYRRGTRRKPEAGEPDA